MTNVNAVVLCPKCGRETQKPRCKYCHHNIVPYENTVLGTPDYFSNQYKRADMAVKFDKGEIKNRADLKAQLIDFLKNISPEDRLDAMCDAFDIIRHCLMIDMQKEDLKNLVKIGIRIGKISTTIDQYIKDGGLSNATINTAESEPSDEDSGEPRL